MGRLVFFSARPDAPADFSESEAFGQERCGIDSPFEDHTFERLLRGPPGFLPADFRTHRRTFRSDVVADADRLVYANVMGLHYFDQTVCRKKMKTELPESFKILTLLAGLP